jgi:hypothetical protein
MIRKVATTSSLLHSLELSIHEQDPIGRLFSMSAAHPTTIFGRQSGLHGN